MGKKKRDVRNWPVQKSTTLLHNVQVSIAVICWKKIEITQNFFCSLHCKSSYLVLNFMPCFEILFNFTLIWRALHACTLCIENNTMLAIYISCVLEKVWQWMDMDRKEKAVRFFCSLYSIGLIVELIVSNAKLQIPMHKLQVNDVIFIEKDKLFSMCK